jgi:hypothetical protein
VIDVYLVSDKYVFNVNYIFITIKKAESRQNSTSINKYYLHNHYELVTVTDYSSVDPKNIHFVGLLHHYTHNNYSTW